MKNLFLALITITLLCTLGCSSCKKETIDPNGLPHITQTGSNTLGFTLNGQPWTPKGVRSTGNLSIDYDPGFRNGIFNIVAYDFTNQLSEQFTIGVSDSLNFIQAPKTYLIEQVSLCGISYSKTCNYFSKLNDTKSSGSMTISKLDRTNRIISGTFNAVLSKQGCDTIKIKDGRFDMKF